MTAAWSLRKNQKIIKLVVFSAVFDATLLGLL